MRPICVAVAILAFAGACVAQQNISLDPNASPEQIKALLQSSDSRLVAWGAWFASRSNNRVDEDAYATLMGQRMARWLSRS